MMRAGRLDLDLIFNNWMTRKRITDVAFLLGLQSVEPKRLVVMASRGDFLYVTEVVEQLKKQEMPLIPARFLENPNRQRRTP